MSVHMCTNKYTAGLQGSALGECWEPGIVVASFNPFKMQRLTADKLLLFALQYNRGGCHSTTQMKFGCYLDLDESLGFRLVYCSVVNDKT